MPFNKHLTEVQQKIILLTKDKPIERIEFVQKYLGTQIPYLGLTNPEQAKAFKSGYSFSHLPVKEQLKIWDYIWHNAQHFEVMRQALYFCIGQRKSLEIIKFWQVVKHWVERIDNWEHSDTLSDIYSRILEQDTQLVYPFLLKWNAHKNPWKRRQSVVSLLTYSRHRKSILPFKQIISLIENLLVDEHYYVQKGVGWALRETGNVYPKETWQFLLTNVTKISTAAFTAAVEKLPQKKKEKLKYMRKQFRRKNTN